MPIERYRKDNENICFHKILLCACKKDLKGQKNGILLLNLNENETGNNNIKYSYIFFDTKNFGVYCFCPLLYFPKKNILTKDEIKDTDYFLVGGFDIDRGKGMIKLYKVNYSKDYCKTTIEFIQDIIINSNNVNLKKNNLNKKNENKNNEFKGFTEAISCIIQSSKDGEILVSCWDGKIYLFELNLENLLENNNKDAIFKKLAINNKFIA